jgi:hypothetical protein
VSGLAIGLLCGFVYWWLHRSEVTRLNVTLSYGLVVGLIIGLVGEQLFGLIGGMQIEIEPAEVLIWSWTSLWWNLMKGLVSGVIGGLVLGLASVLVIGLSIGWDVGVNVGQLIGQVGGVFIAIITGLTSGVSGDILDKRTTARPNQGMWHSFHNSMRIGFISTILSGLTVLFILFLYFQYFNTSILPLGLFGPIALTEIVLSGGFIGGLIGSLRAGGFACLKHVVLRLLLWLIKSIPWNYARFLDHAAERILLRKVGAGYIFIHRLLLDYFASLETIPAHEKSPEHVP